MESEKKNYETHSFSVELATILGLEDAIILQHLYYWCIGNSDNKDMLKDGYIWVYISRRRINETYPYISENRIKGAINRLSEKEYIKISNYNKLKIDKTNWYALTDKAYLLFGTSLVKLTNGQLESPSKSSNHQPLQSIGTSYKDKNKEKEENKKEEKDDFFEEVWKMYERKGSKANAKKRWDKLTEEEKTHAKKHIPFYKQANPEIRYRKDFEGYLNQKTFNSVLYINNTILYDPERNAGDGIYSPETDGISIVFSENTQRYYTTQDIESGHINDGYKDNERPETAVIFKQGRKYIWSKEQMKWVESYER